MESCGRITDSCPLSIREAIESRNYTYLRQYLINESNIYTRESDGFTPLQTALLMDDIKMVRFLLAHKADPNQCYLNGDWRSCSPLHFALSQRSNAMTMLLIEYGAEIFTRSSTMIPAICVAIIYNRVRVFHHLMNKGVSPNTIINDKFSLLTYAVLGGNIRIVKCILEHKPDVNLHQNQRAVVQAIYRGDNHSKRLVKMLYKYGFTLQPADIDANLIEAAINNGHYEAVRNLLKLGISPDFKISSDSLTGETETILHIAVRAGELKIIRLLLECGADVHQRDTDGKTAILIATEMNDLCIIKLLLKYGADVTDADSCGRTVLHFAIMECMEYVYKNLNLRMNRAKTKIVKLLISKGANVNAKKFATNSSSLHFAAWVGLPGAVQVLLAHGARVDEVNFVDMTPLKCAQSEVADLIDGVNIINLQESVWELKLSTLKLLEHHVHRLHRIGFPVCPKDLEEVEENFYKLDEDVSKIINEEIKFIKEGRIANSYMTLYCFLTTTDKKAAALIRNEVFLKSLKAMLHRPTKFLEYSKLMRNKLTAALNIRKLDNVTFRLMHYFFNEKKLPALPDECIEHIISFLSNKDKKLLIDQFTKEYNIK